MASINRFLQSVSVFLKKNLSVPVFIAAGDDDADQGLIFKAAVEQRVKNARVEKMLHGF